MENLQERRENIVRSWENSGLLKGLSGASNPNLFKLFESEREYKIEEDYALPMARRVLSKIPEGCDILGGWYKRIEDYQIEENRIMF